MGSFLAVYVCFLVFISFLMSKNGFGNIFFLIPCILIVGMFAFHETYKLYRTYYNKKYTMIDQLSRRLRTGGNYMMLGADKKSVIASSQSHSQLREILEYWENRPDWWAVIETIRDLFVALIIALTIVGVGYYIKTSEWFHNFF